MGELLGSVKRTHMCGDVRESNVGQEVTLMGWVQKRRNLGSLIFVDLRDREGICQVVFDDSVSVEAFEKANTLRSEFVIAVTGKVFNRQSVNKNIPTGQIEIFAESLKILSTSDVPPIHIDDNDQAGERSRLTYRYLDLRKPKMQNILRTRSKISSITRNFLEEEGYIELETPVLNKPTPEGARDYLVPSRVNKGEFYALPQSPQLFKQLLMVSGFDKYYQIVKCFRDEDLRADRQPEFTQIDIEASFVEQEDILNMNEKLISKLFKEIKGLDVELPIQRMTYKEAMERFGSDKPDLRFGFELKSLNEVAKGCGFGVFSGAVESGGDVRAINIDGGADKFSRKDITKLEDFIKSYKARGLAWMKVTDEGITSPIAKFFTEEEKAKVLEIMEAKSGDLILFVADKAKVVFDSLGALRCEVAKRLDMLDPFDYKFLWVTEFPVFEYDEEDERFYAQHHPFTAPMDEDLEKLESDPANCRAKAYDIIINGYEVGGGSIRIHTPDVQTRMFKALGFSEEEAIEQFGFLINAFKYGTPPHGGIAYGLDRMTMLLTGNDNIRDVIAFPKTQDARCLMTDAPTIANPTALEELCVKVVEEVKEVKEEEKND